MRLSEELARNRGIGPGFHFLRHALSVVILAHHCQVAIRGVNFNDAAAAQAAKMSAHAPVVISKGSLVVELLRPFSYALVGLFFALSGFLVFGSAMRSRQVKNFFINRVVRIVPALSVETALSALILGPLVTAFTLQAYFTDWYFWRYLGNIVGHIWFRLPGVFLSNPWPGMVNANLWTLPSELWCYLGMLVLMGSGLVGNRKFMNIAISVALFAVLVLSIYDPENYSVRWDPTRFSSSYIVMMFYIGAAFYINADKIILDWRLFLASAAIYYGLIVTDDLSALSGIFLAYCMVYIGMRSFAWFDRLLKVDLSYGTYLYGFPLTQAIIFVLLPHLGWLPGNAARFAVIFPLVFVSTLVFALASWTYIEKPALKLRRHVILEPRSKGTAAG